MLIALAVLVATADKEPLSQDEGEMISGVCTTDGRLVAYSLYGRGIEPYCVDVRAVIRLRDQVEGVLPEIKKITVTCYAATPGKKEPPSVTRDWVSYTINRDRLILRTDGIELPQSRVPYTKVSLLARVEYRVGDIDYVDEVGCMRWPFTPSSD